ncbi:protein kinase domain-containing protein [Aureliella helgolandensis]|uniref:Protein kinase domain protein n=1 Tax=Aureliella helgolandensis TaxID=2527968 RepID=A0A518GBS7_9BACT|nr:protein kinase [Aureliella helgolandensis]QDV26072.1 Protein kinase domain protein [Aureliella helgolandensis]
MRKRRIVKVVAERLESFIQSNFETQAQFLDAADIGRTTLHRMLTGESVKRQTILEMVAHLADSGKPLSLDDLVDDERPQPNSVELASEWQQDEWEVIASSIGRLRTMSNGIVMQHAKARHRLLTNEFGRMKVYDIRGLGREMRLRYRDALTRHATVCRKLFETPQISTNITLVARDDYRLWSVVDRWVEGSPLDEYVEQNKPDLPGLISVWLDIAKGIQALHEQSIIGREIRPESILISSDAKHCTLTDLELAKLLEAETTVSSHWQPNPYRAPEILGGESRVQADIYSFAKIAAFTLARSVQEDAQEAIESAALPNGIQSFLTESLSPRWPKRPKSLVELLPLLEREKRDDY